MLSTRTRAGKSIASRFSAAAGTYDNHAGVQARVASQLTALLGTDRPVGSILEVGCGTGLLTKKLARIFPSAQICATDISSKMIFNAQKHFRSKKSILWIAGDFREVLDLGRFDLIVSSSALHWITPLEKTFRKISSHLKKNGLLVFGIMLKGTLAELHEARRNTVPAKAVQKELPPEKEVLNALKAARLQIVRKQRATYRDFFRSGAHCLKSLHEQGVTGGPFSSGRTPLTRSELTELVSYYDKNYKCVDGVYATYNVLYIVAEKI